MPGLSPIETSDLLAAVDRYPELRGFGVAYSGNGMCQQLREPSMPPGLQTWIEVQEVDEFQMHTTNGTPPSHVPPLPPPRESKLGQELFSMAVDCIGAGLTVSAAGFSATAAPITGGTSLVVTAYMGTMALVSGLQCGNSAARFFNEVFDPAANDALDSNYWYEATGEWLDTISVAGAVVSLGSATKSILRLSRQTGQRPSHLLRRMKTNRAGRKRLAQELAVSFSHPNPRKQFIRLARQGKVPKIIQQKTIDAFVLQQMVESIGAALSFTSSIHNDNGTVRKVYVSILES